MELLDELPRYGASRVSLSHLSCSVSCALKALIFDCGGVILESEHLHQQAYNDTFSDFNVKCPGNAGALYWGTEYYDELHNRIGGGKPKMRWYFKEHGWPTWSIFDTPPESDEDQAKLIDALRDWKAERYKDIIRSGTPCENSISTVVAIFQHSNPSSHQGLTVDHPIMTTTEFWTSHECMLLPYEQALTRLDSTSGLYYDCSAHMIWVGEHTRQLDGAHVEFLRGVANPLWIKVSDKKDPKELVNLIEILNPCNKPVRITTRAFDSILAEVQAFFDVHDQEGSHPWGIHLEMTGQNVTECIGGSRTVTFNDLSSRYHTHCDPRLNASQSLELAFLVADRLRRKRMSTHRTFSSSI
ncbi:hypothetical protein MLD38_003299 [Melastoma candidum]|uniref:Uncharacterized protein n=1 Tax=Melastoma candidum TaxID=119954 RepID=A0ACB9S2S8_9MYRT|nr:hypothetical protein MLD38_003299 [Melastoma candidum]